ncbi:hypothetical protein [Actinomadura sp. 9N407]|uniref:hypothetical protein n=1 Tax=Actinomadura sp. 9N407 TaxID=3375154 RepID=UPI0037B86F7A
MRRKALDLSTSQLIASGLATLAAAVGASFLGVYGTIIGAAFMSVVSTAGAAVAKHYLDQGKEQIKERTHLHDAVADETVAQGAATRATSADPSRTVVWPGGDPGATRFDLPLGAGGADPSATRLDRSPAETVADALAAEAGPEAVRRAAWQDAFRDTLTWAKRRWIVLAVSSVAVFAVVMTGITVLEKVTDKPASGWVGANDGQGTTWGNLGGGGGGTPDETPATENTEEAPQPSDAPTMDPGTTTEPTREPAQPPTTDPEPGATTAPPTSQSPEPSVTQPSETTGPGGDADRGDGSGSAPQAP